MKKKTVQKNRSKKSLLLLLLLAVFLIISTYAWFTSNRLVKVNSLNVNVQASEGFQISLDGVNWKSVITAAEITHNDLVTNYASHTNHVPDKMVPVSTAATTDEDTGYMEMFLGSVTTDETTGEYIITSTQEPDDTNAGNYIAFDLFFKTNNDMNLFLEKYAGVTDIGVNSTKDKGMENSARIAFVDQGNIPYATTPNPTGAAAQALKYTTTQDGSNITIWEPNYNEHTAAAKVEALNMYGIPGTSPLWTDTRIPYDGMYAAIPAPKAAEGEDPAIPAVKVAEATEDDNPTYFKATGGTFIQTQKEHNDTDTGIVLQAGVTKMRIYMWLEGQDYDCGDSASGSAIAYDLILTAAKVVTP